MTVEQLIKVLQGFDSQAVVFIHDGDSGSLQEGDRLYVNPGVAEENKKVFLTFWSDDMENARLAEWPLAVMFSGQGDPAYQRAVEWCASLDESGRAMSPPEERLYALLTTAIDVVCSSC